MLSGRDLTQTESQEASYCPNNIGLLVAGTNHTHSYLILGKIWSGTEVEVLNRCARHNVKILSSFTRVDERYKELTMALVCDLTDADLSSDDFLIRLRRIKSVTEVLSAHVAQKLFDRFLFPLTLLDAFRVVALDPNVIFGIEGRLNDIKSRTAILEAGRSYALDIMDRIRKKFPEETDEKTIEENVNGYLRAAGLWGSIKWQPEGDAVRVSIKDPITSSTGNAAGSSFVMGLVSELVGVSQKSKFRPASESYDERFRLLTIVLAPTPLATAVNHTAERNVAI